MTGVRVGRRRSLRALALSVALLVPLGAGCAQVLLPEGGRPYRPLARPLSIPRDTVPDVLRAIASDRRWSTTRITARGHRLVATRPAGDGYRERVVIRARDGQLVVDVQLEMLREGHWVRPDIMCENYQYHREQLLADLVTTQLARLDRAP